MNITKLKIKGSETEIHYGNQDKNERREIVFKSWDKQSPEFLLALQNLKPFLLKVLELEDKYGESIYITGVSIKHENMEASDCENYGVVISAVKSLENSDPPFCINTPYIPPCRNENTNTIMDTYLADAINDIVIFCERFIAGKERAQGELFGE